MCLNNLYSLSNYHIDCYQKIKESCFGSFFLFYNKVDAEALLAKRVEEDYRMHISVMAVITDLKHDVIRSDYVSIKNGEDTAYIIELNSLKESAQSLNVFW